MKKMNFIYVAAFAMALGISPAVLKAQNITTAAGCGIGDDSAGAKAELSGANAIAFDKAGNAYIADPQHARVRMVSVAGVVSTIAGNGNVGYSGDGGPATAATFGSINGLCLDKLGNIYLADIDNSNIRKISTTGIISTIAGTGTAGYNGDNIHATAAQLNYPTDIIADTAGNIIFTDWQNYRVRKINAEGIITTIVGDGASGSTGNHGPATATELGSPYRLTMDNKGNLYVAEVVFQCICKIDTAGILTIIADTTGTYSLGPDGDGGLAMTATMTSPCGLATDTLGNLYFSDIGNNRVRVINLNTGIINNYAGTGVPGYSGDGAAGTAAQFGVLEGLACDTAGNLYICDYDNNRVRYVNKATGIVNTFIGRNGLFDEGYTATDAELGRATNLATDASGNVYIADGPNNRVRKLNAATGTITTVAGNGIAGYGYGFSGDGGPATAAQLYFPYSVAIDNAGNLYIADCYNSRVRKVSAAGIITTLAGNGTAGFSGDGGAAIGAELNYPAGVAVDAAGNVYIADEGNSAIRMVDLSGVIHTVAGTGHYGFSGDGGPATRAELYEPIDIAVDKYGNLYLSDIANNDIRKVDTAGMINSITLNGAAGFSGDGDSSVYAQVNGPAGLKVDSAGNLYFADLYNWRIRMINDSGIISTLAGNGSEGFSGDGGPALSAKLNYPEGVAIDHNGNMYIADGNNFRIRKMDLSYLSVPVTHAASGKLVVFPNPTTNRLTVQLTVRPTGSEQISLFNILGQEVYSIPLLSPQQTIDMSSLPAGEYILQVANNAGYKDMVKVTKE
jgi:sugar lactone lactonase YvrE